MDVHVDACMEGWDGTKNQKLAIEGPRSLVQDLCECVHKSHVLSLVSRSSVVCHIFPFLTICWLACVRAWCPPLMMSTSQCTFLTSLVLSLPFVWAPINQWGPEDGRHAASYAMALDKVRAMVQYHSP
ncbi:putative Beige protein [Fusarium oxysporum f. sp. albedinis]|nr:putative Beige protein [Fusarium oxysporum f. sp. albedinis]